MVKVWQRVNAWVRDNPIIWWLLTGAGIWSLNNATTWISPGTSEWQFDVIWFLVAWGWLGFSIGTALFSKKMWDDIEERQTERRHARKIAVDEKEDKLKAEREKNERLRKQFRQDVRVVAVCRMNFRDMVTKPDTITDLSYHLVEQSMNRVVDKLETEYDIRTPRRLMRSETDVPVPPNWNNEGGRNPFVPLNCEEWLAYLNDIEQFMDGEDLEGARSKYPL